MFWLQEKIFLKQLECIKTGSKVPIKKKHDYKDFKLLLSASFSKGIPQNSITIHMSVMFWPISQCWKSGCWSRPPLLRGSSESEGLFPVCLFLQCLSQKRGKMKEDLPSNQARKVKTSMGKQHFLNSAATVTVPRIG